MTKISYYVATSLDMYIAKPDGGVDWLFHDQDYGYQEFLDSIDCLIMGKKTYDQIRSFGAWPYGELPTFVFTHGDLKTGGLDLITSNQKEPRQLMIELAEQGLTKAWLVGGGELASQFLKLDLLDELILSIHPILIGEGIALFGLEGQQNKMDLQDTKSFDSGLVQLTYHFSIAP